MPDADGTVPLRGLIGIAVALALLCPAAVRAQAPVNPLRPAPSRIAAPVQPYEVAQASAQSDIWAEPADEPVAQLSAAAEVQPLEPRSVVPRQLGPPSPLDPQAAAHAGEQWPGGSPMHERGHAPAGHDSWVQPWFTHTDPNDPYRHAGLGRPLVGTSWLNRPWYVGAFLGGLLADDLIADRVETNNSYFLGGRLGWDFDHYWGLEGRYAFSRPPLDDGAGDTLSDPCREYFVDVSLAYYPWGDSQWRPFFSAGLGFQTFRFRDDLGERVHQSLLSVPLGIGLKLYHSPFHTLRLEAYDNIALGDGHLRSMQNFTLAAGVEFRFGGRPTSYFPWHGTTSHW